MEKEIVDFVEQCHRMAARNLIRCSSGNMSARLDSERFVVSGTRTWLERIAVESAAVCRLSDAVSLNGVKPSVEARFHAGILRSRPEVKVVLHFQTPYATALACTDCGKTDFYVIPEIPYYIGRIGVVPFMAPGSNELAEAVIECGRDHNMVILRNHGLVTVGGDYDEALQRAEFFELACSIVLSAGRDVVPLTREQAKALGAG